MQYQPLLDTALGLGFIYFAAALFGSGFVEWLANILKKRAKTLLVGLTSMLEPGTAIPDPVRDENLKLPRFYTATAKKEAALYHRALNEPRPAGVSPAGSAPAITAQMLIGHPLVQPFKKGDASARNSRNPSYIPADVVARALFDTIRTKTGADFTVDSQGHAIAPPGGPADPVSDMLKKLPDSLKESLLALYRSSQGSVTEFVGQIEKWYDAQMDRVNGTYTRWAKKWGVAAAVVIVLLTHLDSIAIAQDLWSDESVRAAVVASAVDTSCAPDSSSAGDQADCVKKQIDNLASDGLPIGPQQWLTPPGDFNAWLSMSAGFALSVVAISMGAPFWFGLMNKVVNVRNAGNPPESSGK